MLGFLRCPQQHGLSVTETFLRHSRARPHGRPVPGVPAHTSVPFAHRPLLFRLSCVCWGGPGPKAGCVRACACMCRVRACAACPCPGTAGFPSGGSAQNVRREPRLRIEARAPAGARSGAGSADPGLGAASAEAGAMAHGRDCSTCNCSRRRPHPGRPPRESRGPAAAAMARTLGRGCGFWDETQTNTDENKSGPSDLARRV